MTDPAALDIPTLLNHLRDQIESLENEKEKLIARSDEDEDDLDLLLELLTTIRVLVAYRDRGVGLLRSNNDVSARHGQLSRALVDAELQWTRAAALERARYDVLVRHIVLSGDE